MGERIRVLHVDDDPEFAELTGGFLEREDDRLSVDVAASAAEGLERLDHDRFDCIVSDYEMPQHSGIEFLEAVRERYPDLPFVLFTGKGSEEIASDAIYAGVSDYLQKGTDTQQYSLLANRIVNLVQQYRAETKLETRAHQQQVVSELGQDGLADERLDVLFERATESVVDGLGADYCKILEYRPERDDLLLRAGVGWHDSVVGSATVEDDPKSQAGYTLRSEAPVVVENLDTDDRFDGPPLLSEHDVKSGISVVIGSPGDPWGVFGTHTRDLTNFSDDDVNFVRNVTNVLANAIERKQSERDLQQVKDQYQAFVEHASDVITVLGDSGVIRYLSPSIEHVLGHDPENLLGDSAFEYIHPDEREFVAQRFLEVVERSEMVTETVEYRMRNADDEWIWVETTGTNRRVSGIEGFVFTSRDITDRKQREREIDETRRQYETILRHSSDYVIIVDEYGDISYASPSIEHVTGFTPEEVRDTNAFEYVHEKDRELALEAFSDSLKNPDGEVTVEFRAATSDGAYKWIEARGSSYRDEPLIDGLLVNIRDITDRKRRETELERYRMIVDASGDPVYTLDDTGRMTFVNDAMVALTGYEENQLLGEHVSMVMTQSHIERGEDLIRTLLSTDEDRGTFEMDILTADGRRIPCENHVALLPFEDEFRGTVGTIRDISDRVERERRLQKERDRLDEFAGVISHDLRNPLNVAQGRLGLSMTECDSEHLETADRALDRIDELIDDLLALAREGDEVRTPEPVDLRDLVRNCWRNVETAEATLAVEFDDRIRADPSRLQQLLENLIRNAVQHGGDDVTIRVGELDEGFYLEDDGPGIPDAATDDVFEVGYSTSEVDTGFGLSIVKQIVDAHGWTIRVTEGADGGARFEITGVEIDAS